MVFEQSIPLPSTLATAPPPPATYSPIILNADYQFAELSAASIACCPPLPVGPGTQVSHDHLCLLIGQAYVHKSSMYIPALLFVEFLSISLPCSILPSYCSGFSQKTPMFVLAFFFVRLMSQVSHIHSFLLLGQALVYKSPMYILAFLLIGLLSTSIPCSSLPS